MIVSVFVIDTVKKIDGETMKAIIFLTISSFFIETQINAKNSRIRKDDSICLTFDEINESEILRISTVIDSGEKCETHYPVEELSCREEHVKSLGLKSSCFGYEEELVEIKTDSGKIIKHFKKLVRVKTTEKCLEAELNISNTLNCKAYELNIFKNRKRYADKFVTSDITKCNSRNLFENNLGNASKLSEDISSSLNWKK